MVDQQLAMSLQCALVGRKAEGTLECIVLSVACGEREVICPLLCPVGAVSAMLCSALGRQAGISAAQNQRLGDLGLFSLEKAEGRFHPSLQLPERRMQHEGCRSLFSGDVSHEDKSSHCTRRGLDYISKQISLQRECSSIWNRLLKKLVISSLLEIFKIPVDMALKDTVNVYGRNGLMVGLEDLRGLFQLQ